MQILTLNAGSSSLKAKLYWAEDSAKLRVTASASLTGLGAAHPELKIKLGESSEKISFDSSLQSDEILKRCLTRILQAVNPDEPLCFSHRVVHGGDRYSEAQRVDADTLETLRTFIPLAPLHQPHNLHLIELLAESYPDIPSVACFDTMFHAGQSQLETSYALPQEIRDKQVRKYGFHGLSYAYIAQHLSLDQAPEQRTVVLHLGAGASACAVRGSQSVASSMGFSAVDGLPMGTRTGNIDPGVLLFLLAEDWNLERLEKLLYRESGWLGLSGISSDMKTLLESNAEEADFAVDHFCYHIALEVGRLTAALEGIDTLVFTGGVGAHAKVIRDRVCKRLQWLGIKVDSNSSGERISSSDSKVEVFAIETDEELMLAQHALNLVR